MLIHPSPDADWQRVDTRYGFLSHGERRAGTTLSATLEKYVSKYRESRWERQILIPSEVEHVSNGQQGRKIWPLNKQGHLIERDGKIGQFPAVYVPYPYAG